MKKVLSVMLAAAMVMGMSVSAFAADFSVTPDAVTEAKDATTLEWCYAAQVRDDEVIAVTAPDADGSVDVEFELLEGDQIIFGIKAEGEVLTQGAPKNWILKGSYNEYVEDVEFANLKSDFKKVDTSMLSSEDALVVVATLADDFDAKEVEEEDEDAAVEFYMYVWDTDAKAKSAHANIHYNFEEYDVVKISKADAKRVIPAVDGVYYELEKGINSLEVVFSLNEEVYVTAKMWKGEKYMITSDVDAKWSKELSKQYDTDIEILTIESDLDIREVLWEAKKDNKQVVELVDGALVAVDAEFVTKYEVIEDVVLAKGYIAETEEGSYALVDADMELLEAPEAEVEADKANPSTGASDFVGAAVAMAVVSVAAAGALALKK